MTTTRFTDLELAEYRRRFRRSRLFEQGEIDKLLRFAKEDPSFSRPASMAERRRGHETKLALWNHAGDDLYSMFARSPRVVDRMEQALGGEVYLYHMKMMLKEPKVGGAWEWHQDYGYWYHNGCLLPLLASCLIAVTRANQANGCLQVIRGSHLMGRIDHGKTGDQTGADMERVNVALERMALLHIECEPGDAIFFDSNLLHKSDMNTSDDPRWSLICCYNARRNDPYKDSRHPRYSPLAKVGDDAIRQF
jgi:ectoine hydroxylase-related dioxygenase (phytanoyl-CoA dioxygenase family)